MRFVHEKILKSLVFLHILSASSGGRRVFAMPESHVVKWQDSSRGYNKPANLEHYLHVQGALWDAGADQSDRHAERLS